jgi:regulator of sirC expression with transglutaminase-like and TPR domain
MRKERVVLAVEDPEHEAEQQVVGAHEHQGVDEVPGDPEDRALVLLAQLAAHELLEQETGPGHGAPSVTPVPDPPPFTELAADPAAPLDRLVLALAAEFGHVDADAALGTLDELGEQLLALVRHRGAVTAEDQAAACTELLGERLGFTGDAADYDHPDNSMLDVVLERRRGLPIVLSVVYVEVARRAGVDLRGVGLPGHFVVGHFGADPPLLLDPFGGGARLDGPADRRLLAPWAPAPIAMRMLNNLVAAHQRRGSLTAAIRAAALRLALPVEAAERTRLETELRAMQARLN